MLSQRVVSEPATLVLVSHAKATVNVSLVGKKDDNRGPLPTGRVSEYLRSDFWAIVAWSGGLLSPTARVE
jgi:hypothetical protein